MHLDAYGIHCSLGNPNAFLVDIFDQSSFDLEAGIALGAANARQQELKGTQRFACPVDRNQAEEAVLNRIPL